MKKINNIVYIVGGDHHNGLGLGRILGMNQIRVIALVITDTKTAFIGKSKYISETHLFLNEKNAFDYLSKVKTENADKPFIIPYSDTAAFELDRRLNEFVGRFYVPSINKKQGEIAKLMDKQHQYEFAISHGIRMAKTFTISLNTFAVDVHNNIIPFPCIIKPVISAEGDKRDISICNSCEELLSELEHLRELEYERVLVQEYLAVDYEIDVFGCILHQRPFICQIPTRTYRSWLPKGGTNSFSQIIIDDGIVSDCKKIIEEVSNYGFYGLFDIELFVIKDEVFLNEINFRNSGDVYMGLNQEYYYPYAWILDTLNQKVNILPNPEKAEYAMTECADIRNVFVHEIGFCEWIKDFRRVSDFALKFRGDMKPAVIKYCYYFKQFIWGKRL